MKDFSEKTHRIIKNRIPTKALCYSRMCVYLCLPSLSPEPLYEIKAIGVPVGKESGKAGELNASTFSCSHFISFCFLKAHSK